MTDILTEEEKELQFYKEEAKRLNITVRGNVSLKTLKEKVETALEAATNPDNVDNKVIAKAKTRAELKKEQKKLLRFIITNNDPRDAAQDYGKITVSNNLDTISIAFPQKPELCGEDGWFIPEIAYNALKEKTFAYNEKVKDNNGQVIGIKPKTRKKYTFIRMADLTEEELKEWKKKAKQQG
jgi:hypothetical protein